MTELSLDNLISDEKLHLPAGTVELIKKLAWEQLDAHKDAVVYTVKVWIFKKTFTVADLFPVFELILGPRPTA